MIQTENGEYNNTLHTTHDIISDEMISRKLFTNLPCKGRFRQSRHQSLTKGLWMRYQTNERANSNLKMATWHQQQLPRHPGKHL